MLKSGRILVHNVSVETIQALYQVTVLLILNFRGRSILGLENDNPSHATKVKNTLIFNAFVLGQVNVVPSNPTEILLNVSLCNS